MFWIQSNFQVSKKQQQWQKQQKKAFTRSKRSHLVYFVQSQSELSQNETNKRRRQGMHRSLRRTFFRPERPTLASHSLQSIMHPFQKRFREVFGNARIFIFYFCIKAWKEKSLHKSHLGWFFLVFGEVKATKENMSIFWFIWPLKNILSREL